MADSTHYVIRGRLEGRERLRVLARVMRTSSISLFERVGLRDGLDCLDVGCGGGDATLELARRVGPHGKVIGVDIDETKLQIARAEAAEQGVRNVEFRISALSRALLRDGHAERWRSEHRPRLPVLLKRGGFEAVGVGIVQPVGTEGEVKLLNPLTMENIASAVLADGLASQHEIDDVVRELYEFAADPNTVAGMPRVVQAWGRRPVA